MKTILIMLCIFSGLCAYAGEKPSWFCLDESGKRDGDVLWSCGVGEAPSESLARQDALKTAMIEFKTICDASADCEPSRVTVEPKRMTCMEIHGGWKCYRLIEVVMIPKKERTFVDKIVGNP